MSGPSRRWLDLVYASPYVLVLLLVALQAIGRGGGELPDTDCYLRLHRVENLHAGQGWYDGSVPRSNAPYGASLHWTRPLDVLLIAGASAGAMCTDFRTALLGWGSALSPLLELLAVFAFGWALRPMLGKAEILLVQILFALSGSIIAYFGWGRADHHSLLMLLFIVSLGFAVRIVMRPYAAAACRAAGLVVALMMWVSPEGLIAMGLIAGVLGLLWLIEPGDVAKKALQFQTSLAVGLVAALLAERPPVDLLAAELDRISVVHVVIAALLALFWGLVALRSLATWAWKSQGRRASAAAIGVVAFGALLIVAFPSLLGGPSTWLDSSVRALWEIHVREVQPLLGGAADFSDGFLRLAAALPSILGLAWIVFALRRSRGTESRPGWILLSAAALSATVLGLSRVRWTGYAAIALLPFHVCLFFALLDAAHRRLARPAKIAAFVALAAVFAFGGEIAWAVRAAPDSTSDPAAEAPRCSLADLCRELESNPRFATPVTILAPIDDGPEILWLTRHSVVSTPHHRNRDGILDTIRAFSSSSNDVAAREITKARSIRLILVHIPKPDSEGLAKVPSIYRTGGVGASFYESLAGGTPPPWAKPVALPPPLAACFRLYEVVP